MLKPPPVFDGTFPADVYVLGPGPPPRPPVSRTDFALHLFVGAFGWLRYALCLARMVRAR